MRNALAGCAHDKAPTSAAAPADPALKPPRPADVWTKPGATTEEFQRTRARCLLRARFGSEDYNVATYPLCMRAEGWVLGPPTPGAR